MNDQYDRHDEIPELQALEKTIAPGPEVESAVIAALHRRGFLRRPRPRRTWLAAAAVVLAFAGGVWVGRGTAPGETEAVPSSTVQSLPPAAPGTTVTWF